MNILRTFLKNFLDGLWVLQAVVKGKILCQGDYIPKKDEDALRLPLVPTTEERLLMLVREWGYTIPRPDKLRTLLFREIALSRYVWNTQRIIHFRFDGCWVIRSQREVDLFRGKQILPIFFIEYEGLTNNQFGPPVARSEKKQDKPCPNAPVPDAMRRQGSAFGQRSNRDLTGSLRGHR